MQELMDDVVWEESFNVVTDAIKDLVEVHLEKAAAYDIVMDMCTEIIETEGPDIVSYGKISLTSSKWYRDK